ncbi:LLM class flavin-dependent oxidoreductase [Virgibacillus dokdonensis]|uniref:LLM class flavin-dependent oxidoreductase n=1 Tax=Virgibacillus dokdonensis TaxID=302167 RepID=A0ABU7VL07_9BACI
MKLGLLMPLGINPFKNNLYTDIEEIASNYLDTLWVRDVPIASNYDNDLGSWYDPFTYLGFLARNLRNTNCKLGIATINASIRNPIITTKEILSIQSLTDNKFILGLGGGDKKDILDLFNVEAIDKEKLVGKFLNHLNSSIILKKDNFIKGGTYALPENYKPPEIHLASSSETIWSNSPNILNGWMVWYLPPKLFKEKLNKIKKLRNIDQVTLSLNLIIKKEDILEVGVYKGITCIYVSINRLKEFFSLYKNMGVTQFLVSIIYSENFVYDIIRIKDILEEIAY